MCCTHSVAADALPWESWLRYGVPMAVAEAERVSVSFNYRWT
jgi:hypothetical protein